MRVAIFGTGSALRDFLSILPAEIEIVGLGDNDPSQHGKIVQGYLVHSASDFVLLDSDIIVIAARAVDPIRRRLVELGARAETVHAYYPSFSDKLVGSINADIDALNGALGVNLPRAGIATMYVPDRDRPFSDIDCSGDVVRNRAFILAAMQVINRNIEGSVAELGVYKGDQARLLNKLFPDRPLHLFDTFEGFAAEDLVTEHTSGFSGAAVGDFKDTSEALVMSKMGNPDVVHLHKGYFPKTAEGVDDNFAFVSLDVDLCEPTLAGLNFFYPKLAKGGFIFVHDYDNARYRGARDAVDGFLKATSATAMPLPDFAGSIVVMK